MKHTYDFLKKEDKYFFAGLFNTAKDNFDLSLNELNKRLNYKEIKGKDKELRIIEYAFHKDRTQLDFDNSFKYLSESLSFLNRIQSFIAKKNNRTLILRNFIKDFLIDLYKLLDSNRNYYTHFEHEKVTIDNPLITEFLDYILFNSISRIKDDKVKTESVKDKLLSKYKDDYSIIINNKNKWIDENNIKLKKEGKRTNKRINNNTVAGYNYVLNSIFRRFIDDSTKKPHLKEDSKSTENNGLSYVGYIQFLALFLNKRQINLLFDNISYTKYTDTLLQRIITRWIFTYESYRNVKHLFKSSYDHHALLLQMVSELTKCPNNLYPHLSDKKKDEFVEDLNIYFQENDNSFEDDTLISHEVIRKRYEDKFPYFAIRFLDDFMNFPSLRFQVNMGKFIHDSREKEFNSTGKKTERLILEKLIVFENLSEATKKKNLYFEKTKNNKNTDWVEHPRPKYQFYNNSIGIWLDCDGLGYYEEEATLRKSKPTKYEILDKLKLKDSYKKPLAYLSVNELPAILYSILMEGRDSMYIENKIKGKIIQQRKFIENISLEKDYNNEEIKSFPKKLKLILTENSSINKAKIKRQITKEKEVNPLGEIRKYYTPKNETELSLSEKGKIATWLSKDIKRFVAKEVKGPSEEDKNKSWKGYQFSEFQALLSYYDIDKSKLSLFLQKDLRLKIEDFPFKGLSFTHKSLYDFYVNYLASRKEYLEFLLKNIEHLKDDILLLPFNASKFKIQQLEKYKENKLKGAVMLPRGIFDKKPTTSKENDKTKFADWFAMSMNNNHAQEFYNYNKTYLINDNTITINPNIGIKEQYKNIASEHQKTIYKNEVVIRKTMRNDFYVLQMIKSFFKDTSEVDKETFKNITLKDFYLTKAEKEQTKKRALEQSERQKGNKEENIFNENYILNKRIKLSLLEGKIVGEVSLKESSKYKRLSKDPRVIQLTNYNENKVWGFQEIIYEIIDYELIKSNVLFKTIHELEKEIFLKAKSKNDLELLTYNGHPNFKKYLAYYFIKEESKKEEFNRINIQTVDLLTIDDDLKNLVVLLLIRNKFSHNQLVSKLVFDYLITYYPKNPNEKVASYLNRVFGIIIDSLK